MPKAHYRISPVFIELVISGIRHENEKVAAACMKYIFAEKPGGGRKETAGGESGGGPQAHTQNITHPAPEKNIERVEACEKEKEFWETSSFQTPPTK